MTIERFAKIKKEVLKLKSQKKGVNYIANKLNIDIELVENIIRYGVEYKPEDASFKSKHEYNLKTFDRCVSRQMNLSVRVKIIEEKLSKIYGVVNHNAKCLNNLIKRVKALEDKNKPKVKVKHPVCKYDPWKELEDAIKNKDAVKCKNLTGKQVDKVNIICKKYNILLHIDSSAYKSNLNFVWVNSLGGAMVVSNCNASVCDVFEGREIFLD